MKLIQERNKSVTYKEARVYLDEMSKYGSVLGLDTIRGLLHELGDPQDDLKFIHIAGTNGKGSVLAYTSTILSEAGYRIGRYVSPTVISYLERIQMNGRWISEEEFAELTEKVKAVLPKEIPAEVVCTLICYYLANRQDDCEWVVLPVANFDAYFGDTSFSKKYLPKIPPEIVERSSSFGISRYRITEEYLP